jgi:hypothetical protein
VVSEDFDRAAKGIEVAASKSEDDRQQLLLDGGVAALGFGQGASHIHHRAALLEKHCPKACGGSIRGQGNGCSLVKGCQTRFLRKEMLQHVK